LKPGGAAACRHLRAGYVRKELSSRTRSISCRLSRIYGSSTFVPLPSTVRGASSALAPSSAASFRVAAVCQRVELQVSSRMFRPVTAARQAWLARGPLSPPKQMVRNGQALNTTRRLCFADADQGNRWCPADIHDQDQIPTLICSRQFGWKLSSVEGRLYRQRTFGYPLPGGFRGEFTGDRVECAGT
jgi:hypothetical protein